MTASTPMMTTPAPASTPERAPLGWWIIAGTPITDPYPCRCNPPCRTRGEKTCPCMGRTDVDNVPETCCAAVAAKTSAWRATTLAPALPVPRRWAAPTHGWFAPITPPAGPDIHRPPRWAAPMTDQQHQWFWPIRVREPWERQSRHPRAGEADCDLCGELMADTLVKQGYTCHVGC
jgi:hypothetical protein